jgi:hypothetical protein
MVYVLLPVALVSAGDWDNFLPSDEFEVMTGAASGSCFGRMYGYDNSSFIYIVAADDAAPSIQKDLQFGSRLPNATNAWAILACDPYADTSGPQFDPHAILSVQLLMAEEGKKLESVRNKHRQHFSMAMFHLPTLDFSDGIGLPASQTRLSGILEMC